MSDAAVVDLDPYTIPHAYWTNAIDPATGLAVPGIGARMFALFCEPSRNPAGVELTALELVAKPALPGQEERRPDVVTVETFDSPEPRGGRVVFEGRLDWRGGDVARIELPAGVRALAAASVRCHWKHPVAVSSYQLHPEPWNVPFGSFDGAKWFGRRLTADHRPLPEPPVRPRLSIGKLEPKSPSSRLRIWHDARFAHFESDVLKVSFSLVRPRMSYLAWDALGTRRLERNFLADRHAALASGPFLRDLGALSPAMHWGGEVELIGSTLRYTNLRCHDGIAIDVTWTVEADAFVVELDQRATHARTFLDAASWRLVFDGQRTHSLATLAEPSWGDWRNGMTAPRGGWHAAGQGTLSFEITGAANHHAENLGFFGHKAISDLQVGARPEPFGPLTLLPGVHSANLHMSVSNIEPALAPGTDASRVHRGLRRAWGTIFAFRPEHGGFSNNAHSANCHHIQHWVADVAAYTAPHRVVPSMTRLMRHTVELALKGGPGCASQFASTLDSAPSLVIAAGRCHQVEPDDAWLRDIWPWLRRAIVYILDSIDDTGMYTSRLRSGNSVAYGQPHPPSSNAWDAVGFGHHDGYCDALAYRALRNAAALARDAGDADLGIRSDRAAATIRRAFVSDLLNPQTGWLAAWRSADGQLHDPGAWCVTAAAACFGMLEDAPARQMLGRLEQARIDLGFTDFRYGLPAQLRPIPLDETRVEAYDRPFACGGDFVPSRADGADTFGIFTNGGESLAFVQYYLRATSKYGFARTADQICDALLQSLDESLFEGPPFDGCEVFTSDGMKCGYEGTLATIFGVVVPIAQHRGWIAPREPEWWPG